jgi:hypothetical protein
MQEVPDIGAELLDDRTVQAMQGTKLFLHLLGGIDRQKQHGGVAGQPRQEEYQDHQSQQGQQAGDCALSDHFAHGRLPDVKKRDAGLRPRHRRAQDRETPT